MNTNLLFALNNTLKKCQHPLNCFQTPLLLSLLFIYNFFFSFAGPLGLEIKMWHFAGAMITGRYQSCILKKIYSPLFAWLLMCKISTVMITLLRNICQSRFLHILTCRNRLEVKADMISVYFAIAESVYLLVHAFLKVLLQSNSLSKSPGMLLLYHSH